jgi:hypothetical protein
MSQVLGNEGAAMRILAALLLAAFALWLTQVMVG